MVLEKIRQFLTAQGVSFREVHHEPTYTSEQSAAARGEEIRVGGKALLCKGDDGFRLFVLSASLKLDSNAARKHLGISQLRFATREELLELTGLVPGCVPPFGAPILPFELYVDPSIFENEKIAFNAGSLTHSIIMTTEDYRRVTQAKIFGFSKPC